MTYVGDRGVAEDVVQESWLTTCAGCGAVNPVGRVHVYIQAPGVVVRCPDCEQVLMRLVHGGGRYWVDLRGMRCLECAAPE